MENLILFDDDRREHLKPFTYTRPIGEFRVGILKIREKWQRGLRKKIAYYHTADYLSTKYPVHYEAFNLLVNGSILPNDELCIRILKMPIHQVLVQGETVVAAKLEKEDARAFFAQELSPRIQSVETDIKFSKIDNLWDIFQKNGEEIERDFKLITANRKSQPLSPSNHVIGDRSRIFLEKGVSAECAIFNTTTGSIYLGTDSAVMEGSIIRGNFALCTNACTKLGTRIYGATTIGPQAKIGGEVNNSVIFGYSNKAHEGFLGHTVVGEWCNMGADSSNSDLKNNYGEVRIWNYPQNSFVRTGTQFCGLMLGDHSKCAVNTSFNTGAVVGVFANIFGGAPAKFVPSFSWGNAASSVTYQLDKVFETAALVMKRRNQKLREEDKEILAHVMAVSSQYRNWEKKKKEI